MPTELFPVGGMALDKWLESIGRKGHSTQHRWVEQGLIHPVNILGKLFVTQEEVERFWARAKAGEFAKEATGICGAEAVKEHRKANQP